MVANRKVTGTAVSMPMGLLIGTAVSLGLTLTGAAVLAKLIETEAVAEIGIGYGTMLILLLASMTGSLMAYAKIKRQRMLVCALNGLIYFLVLLSMTAIFFGGQYAGIPVTALVILAGSVSAGFMGLHERKKKNLISYRRRNR